MVDKDVRLRRVNGQQLLSPEFDGPAGLVSHMGAMQAQEYAIAKWAIAVRLKGTVTDAEVEAGFNAGKILRTHILRPTWHFVSPKDIGWMMQLSGPRVQQANASSYKKQGMDARFLVRCATIFQKALEGHNYQTRDVLRAELAKHKIVGDGNWMAHVAMFAELEGLIISGPRQGNRFTYALMEERVPKAAVMTREEALYQFCKTYYTSRGPATLHDFTAWSGLTLKDARAGVALLGDSLQAIALDGMDYYFMGEPPAKRKLPTLLLPDYDEYFMAYKDRSMLVDAGISAGLAYGRVVLDKGMRVGLWKRTVAKDTVQVDIRFDKDATPDEAAVTAAAKRFALFLGKEPELKFL